MVGQPINALHVVVLHESEKPAQGVHLTVPALTLQMLSSFRGLFVSRAFVQIYFSAPWNAQNQ